MKLDSLQDLLVHELKDLFSAENQIIEALPKMAKAASSPDLKAAFEEHLAQTEAQAQRIEQIFNSGAVDGSPRGHKCKAMEGLIEEAEELLKEDAAPEVLDAALIGAAQRVEHYEMAGYGTARTYANRLGLREAASLLQQTLDEEELTDRKLTQLAESHINREAQ